MYASNTHSNWVGLLEILQYGVLLLHQASGIHGKDDLENSILAGKRSVSRDLGVFGDGVE